MKEFTLQDLITIYDFAWLDGNSNQKPYHGTNKQEAKEQYVRFLLKLAKNGVVEKEQVSVPTTLEGEE